jgi:hypothetical protein
VARTAEVLAMSVSGGVDAAADPLADLAADLAGAARRTGRGGGGVSAGAGWDDLTRCLTQ